MTSQSKEVSGPHENDFHCWMVYILAPNYLAIQRSIENEVRLLARWVGFPFLCTYAHRLLYGLTQFSASVKYHWLSIKRHWLRASVTSCMYIGAGAILWLWAGLSISIGPGLCRLQDKWRCRSIKAHSKEKKNGSVPGCGPGYAHIIHTPRWSMLSRSATL